MTSQREGLAGIVLGLPPLKIGLKTVTNTHARCSFPLAFTLTANQTSRLDALGSIGGLGDPRARRLRPSPDSTGRTGD